MTRRLWAAATLVLLVAAATPGQDKPRGVDQAAGTDLWVSEDGRNLVLADGKPFLYLADTGWELFARTNREEALRYLDDRKAKRFTVIQTAFLALAQGPNAYGHKPVNYGDLAPITTPGADPADARAYDYWDHVDFVLHAVAERGLHVAVAPFRQQLLPKDSAHAERFGRYLGGRYGRQPHLIWLVGFDVSADQLQTQADAYRAVARGIAAGAGEAAVLRTFHPAGPYSSSRWFHGDAWLGCNMVQSGHRRDAASWKLIAADYARRPAKPVLDAEATYEGHPLGDAPRDPKTGKRPLSDDADVRKYAYWNLLAGACGHAYGHHSVWQMYAPGRHAQSYEAVIGWKEALDAPGAKQMAHVRALLEARPVLSRVPDQSLVLDEKAGADHLRAARGDGYAFVYTPEGRTFTAALGKVSGDRVRALWFDPRTGASQEAGEFANRGTREFTPPSSGRGNDWVLILDDPAKQYAAPKVGE